MIGVYEMSILSNPDILQKRLIDQIQYRLNVVKGVVESRNPNDTFNCYIAGETVIYPNIPTFSRNPKLGPGDKVVIEFINGCRETPAILAPEDIRERPDTTLPGIKLFESQLVYENEFMNAYGTRWVAYFFQAESNHTVESIYLLLNQEWGPGIITAAIYPNEGAGNFKPVIGGGALTSGTTDGDTLPSELEAPEWREIEVTPYNLISGTWYSIVLTATLGWKVNWFGKDNVVTAPNQWRHFSSDNGLNWYAGVFDLTFKIFGR